MVGLAQLVSASGCGPEGRGFESHISPQEKREQVYDLLSFFSYIRLAVSYMHFVRDIAFGSDMRFAHLKYQGEYNITVERSGAISLLQSKNITLSASEAYH